MSVLLKVTDLEAAYGGIKALRGVSLQVEEGEVVAVLGANGAGKSTLLKCISSVMKTTGGSIEFDGKPVSKKPFEVVRSGLVQVPEARQIFAKLTVEENLRIGSNQRKDHDGIKKDMEHVYELFPRLKERQKQYGGLLSGGEQQRVAIARSLLNSPDVVLADEPTGNLDSETADGIMALMMKIHHDYRPAIIIVTHNRIIIDRYPGRVLLCKDGRCKEVTNEVNTFRAENLKEDMPM